MTTGGLHLGGLILGLVGGLVWCLVLVYLLDKGE